MAREMKNHHKYDAIIANVASVQGNFQSLGKIPNPPARIPMMPVGINNTTTALEAYDTTITCCLLYFSSFFSSSNLGRF